MLLALSILAETAIDSVEDKTSMEKILLVSCRNVIGYAIKKHGNDRMQDVRDKLVAVMRTKQDNDENIDNRVLIGLIFNSLDSRQMEAFFGFKSNYHTMFMSTETTNTDWEIYMDFILDMKEEFNMPKEKDIDYHRLASKVSIVVPKIKVHKIKKKRDVSNKVAKAKTNGKMPKKMKIAKQIVDIELRLETCATYMIPALNRKLEKLNRK